MTARHLFHRRFVFTCQKKDGDMMPASVVVTASEKHKFAKLANCYQFKPHTHTLTHARKHKRKHTYIHTHAKILTNIRTHIHANQHAHSHIDLFTQIYTHSHTYTHTYRHNEDAHETHTHMYNYIYKLTHPHTYSPLTCTAQRQSCEECLPPIKMIQLVQ